MCNFASLVAMKDGRVLYKLGCDSHYEILEYHNIPDRSDYRDPPFAYVEITPVGNEPLDKWNFKVDERTTPDWFDADYKRACYSALKKLLKEEAQGVEVVNTDGSWSKFYRVNGKYHNLNGPAITYVYSNGSWSEQYYKNGELHNLNGPAYIQLDSDGSWEEEYYKDGDRYMVVNVRCNGSWYVRYYQDGQLHNSDDPAKIEVKFDGSWCEIYYKDGKLHNPNGPAVTKVYSDGSWSKQYHEDGEYQNTVRSTDEEYFLSSFIVSEI